jgi:hypothetical protein
VAKLDKWIAVASQAGARGLNITLIGGESVSIHQPLDIGEDYVAGSSTDEKHVGLVVTYSSIALIRVMPDKLKGF